MTTPNSNGDDADATDSTTRNGDAESATLRSPDSDRSHDEQASETAVDLTDSSDPNERITELEALRDALRAENERLRTDYVRARAISYRRTALALAAVGVVALLGGVAFPDVRAVSFVTGAIGLYGAVMTWYLTPGRVVPISVSESVYDAATTTLTGLRDELGLQAVTVYVPVGDRVRGFVPGRRDFDVPDDVAHAFPNEGDPSEGLSFEPSGRRLTREVDGIRTTDAPDAASEAVEQLADSLVDHFGVADRVAIERETDPRRFVVSVDDAAFGPLTRLDHPIVSALACAAARCAGEPVIVESVEDATATLELMSSGDE